MNAAHYVDCYDAESFVISAGEQGPPGPQGPPGSGVGGSGVPADAFSFGDASPQVVFTAPSNGLLAEAAILVATPFNGANATLSLSSGATSILAASQITPQFVATYSVSPGLAMAGGDTVTLTIVPGFGATQGQGFVFFNFLVL